MSKTLILMRHAKSSWDDPAQSDHDRPLNARGRASAHALGDWLRVKGYEPNRALVSSARRTCETFERLQLTLEPEVDEALYHAGPTRILAALKATDGDTVLLVGHNPGIAECAERLVTAAPDHARFFDYPTGATLVASFDIDDWSAVEFGTGTAVDFVIPRDLSET
ncbi:SixA phosphatase family protein [Arenibacterium sp. CAU 1754]